MPQPHQKRRPQNQRQSRPNKAQQREAQVRAEQMAATPSPELLSSDEDVTTEEIVTFEENPEVPEVMATTETVRVPASQKSRRDGRRNATRKPVAGPVAPTITREQEYQFIRADLRRLLITAGTVLVLMLALLFVVEG
ncbi:MAG: hypothetical protein QM753_09140 [Thermomicrobiales bacterium]